VLLVLTLASLAITAAPKAEAQVDRIRLIAALAMLLFAAWAWHLRRLPRDHWTRQSRRLLGWLLGVAFVSTLLLVMLIG
jgi:hypothetical protein